MDAQQEERNTGYTQALAVPLAAAQSLQHSVRIRRHYAEKLHSPSPPWTKLQKFTPLSTRSTGCYRTRPSHNNTLRSCARRTSRAVAIRSRPPQVRSPPPRRSPRARDGHEVGVLREDPRERGLPGRRAVPVGDGEELGREREGLGDLLV